MDEKLRTKTKNKLRKKLKNYSNYFTPTLSSVKSTKEYTLPTPSKTIIKQNKFKSKDEKCIISIPTTSTGSIKISKNMPTKAFKSSIPSLSTDNTVSISLPNQDLNTFSNRAVKTSDNTIVYTEYQEDTDVGIQVFKGSVKIHTVLNSAISPTRFEYKLNIPLGSRITKLDNDGILILDKNKKFIGGFTPPWAIDAEGKEIPTHYEIKDNKLIQVIDHLSVNTRYPVVADPFFGMDLIRTYFWVYKRHFNKYTMKVTPTAWARSNGGAYLVGVWGWDELYDWAAGPYGLNYNLGDMRDQYMSSSVCMVQEHMELR